MTPICVYITHPSYAEALELSRQLVENGLAAGVNIIPSGHSVYVWRGKIHEKSECFMFVQTDKDQWESLVAFIKARHPYDTPCVIGWGLGAGNREFLDWIIGNCKGEA